MSVHEAENLAASPLRFEVDGLEVHRDDRGDRGGRRDELGAIYHSHTRSEPYPSQTDINFAAGWPGVEWLIVGLRRDGEPSVRCYRIDDGEVREVQVPSMAADALVCPSCGALPAGRRALLPARAGCRSSMPAAPAEEPVAAAHERARKIKPQYTEGTLVRVAGARHQAEAEFVQGLLLEEGIPSMLRRSRGFDVPDMLAAGPRDVMVPASGAAAAREVLLAADLLGPEEAPRTRSSGPAPARRPGRGRRPRRDHRLDRDRDPGLEAGSEVVCRFFFRRQAIRGMPCCPAQVSGRGHRMAGRRASLGHFHLATHPGVSMLDRLTRSRVLRLSRLEQVKHVLRARSRPKSEELVIRIGEDRTAADRHEARISDPAPVGDRRGVLYELVDEPVGRAEVHPRPGLTVLDRQDNLDTGRLQFRNCSLEVRHQEPGPRGG